MAESRTQNSVRNIAAGLIGQGLDLVLAFVNRAIFLKFLTTEYLGISGLFSNILSVLNLAELGIGTAIVFALYKPLATNDKDKIKSLMKIYRKAYFIIGLVIAILGCALMPFLSVFMKGSTDLVDEKIIFGLYIFQSIASYWFFAYKTALLQANQKSYISSIISYSVACIGKIIQIVFLYLLSSTPTLSFYIYTSWGVIFNISYNIIISKIVDKKYPFIKEKTVNPITKTEKEELTKNIYGLTLYKISSTANDAADSIIISSYVGVSLVGLYSNYRVVLTAIAHILEKIFAPLTASIGNMYVSEPVEKTESFFWKLHFVYFWLGGFCSICLFILFNPFIGEIWLGKKYLLSSWTVFAIALNFLVDQLMGAPIRYRAACGLFYQSRYRAILATIVNITLSILSVKVFDFGVTGVIFATVISRLAVTLWFDPFILFKNVFGKSPWRYYCRYFRDLLLVILTGGITYYLSLLVPLEGILHFVLLLLLCMLFPNVLWLILFGHTEEFKYLKGVAEVYIKKILKSE